VHQAPLAAGALHDERGGAAGPAAALLPTAARGRSQVPAGAAGAAHAAQQVPKQVAGEQHVDPGVAAAVEAGQQHGDDEGRVWMYRDINQIGVNGDGQISPSTHFQSSKVSCQLNVNFEVSKIN